MASMAIRESLSSICFSSSGIAVISLDFSSVATWPKAMPSSLAQALTMCRGPRWLAASCEPRQVLPSMATSRLRASGVGRRSLAEPGLKAALEGLRLQRDQQPTNAIA